jgi:hypothetical protein
MTTEDTRILAAYSGWGGLSIDAVKDHFPAGFPVPEARGLIHEYYTPGRVAAEVARVVRPLLPTLAGDDGVVLALEPSAGIGRFIRAFSGTGFESVRWLAVEWSELSGRMLQAIRSDLAVYVGPFERWVREHGDAYGGRVRLVVSNPPYGTRGASVGDDPVRMYRERQAYAYFLRRGLDLLAPGGLGIYLVPSGFLTGRAARNVALRDKVLRRHHLAAAFRLPSRLVPGAMLVTDLLFFRARGGALPEVDAEDRFVLEGHYFEHFPVHILGTEIGRDAGDDDQSVKPRWGYQVVGEFTRLPELVERPMCAACAVPDAAPPGADRKEARAGVTCHLAADTQGLPEPLAAAVALGVRVDRYLSAIAREDSEEPAALWPELHDALVAWTKAHSNPWDRSHCATSCARASPAPSASSPPSSARATSSRASSASPATGRATPAAPTTSSRRPKRSTARSAVSQPGSSSPFTASRAARSPPTAPSPPRFSPRDGRSTARAGMS